jgi:hypothetical protein
MSETAADDVPRYTPDELAALGIAAEIWANLGMDTSAPGSSAEHCMRAFSVSIPFEAIVSRVPKTSRQT